MSSLIDNVPDELLERITARRAANAGPDTLFNEFEAELAPYGVTFNILKSWIYGRLKQGTRRPPPANVTEKLGKIVDLLERSGIDPEDVGEVKAVRLSTWQGLTKNAEGDAEIHELEGASIVLTPSWDAGPKWPVVDRGPAVKLPVVRPRKPAVPDNTERWERAFIWPDTQVGFRRNLTTMELEPFHDETAIGCALELLRKVHPNKVVILGDFVDFAEFGTFDQEPGFALTVQPAVDRATLLLAEIRQSVGPDTEITFIEGNHDRRLQKNITRNAMAAFGLKRGNSESYDWPVLSVPYLLRMDEMNVTYVGGYPAGLVWINENLAAIHGAKVNSAGSTALRVIDDSRVSVMFGHVHRVELVHRTRQAFSGAKRSFAASVGCLCRTDGAVPSTKASTDIFGNSVPTVENWQQAVACVTYQPGDGLFHLDLIPIQNGTAILFGEEVTVG